MAPTLPSPSTASPSTCAPPRTAKAQPLTQRANQITYAYGSLLKTDTLYNLCTGGAAPIAVCQNGVMDYVLHPVEPLTFRLTIAGAF